MDKKESILRRAIDKLYDIFFPKKCQICFKYGSFMCKKCFDLMEVQLTPVCACCGRISENYKYCPNCKRKHTLALDGLIYSTVYSDESVKKMLHLLKFAGYTEIADILALKMFKTLAKTSLFNDFTLIPIPLFEKRLNTRGFNQSELIANNLAKYTGLSISQIILRCKNTFPQSSLNRKKRQQNMTGAFKIVKGSKILKNVLLIDDVSSTGATLNQAAITLKAAGSQKVFGLVFSYNKPNSA